MADTDKKLAEGVPAPGYPDSPISSDLTDDGGFSTADQIGCYYDGRRFVWPEEVCMGRRRMMCQLSGSWVQVGECN